MPAMWCGRKKGIGYDIYTVDGKYIGIIVQPMRSTGPARRISGPFKQHMSEALTVLGGSAFGILTKRLQPCNFYKNFHLDIYIHCSKLDMISKNVPKRLLSRT